MDIEIDFSSHLRKEVKEDIFRRAFYSFRPRRIFWKMNTVLRLEEMELKPIKEIERALKDCTDKFTKFNILEITLSKEEQKRIPSLKLVEKLE